LAEKVTEGNPGKRKLKVLDFEKIATEPEGVEMPPPKEFLSAAQRDGSTLSASELYEEAWKWLERRGCAELVSPDLLERYAVSAARWIHCEEAVSSLECSFFGSFREDNVLRISLSPADNVLDQVHSGGRFDI